MGICSVPALSNGQGREEQGLEGGTRTPEAEKIPANFIRTSFPRLVSGMPCVGCFASASGADGSGCALQAVLSS